MIVDLAVDFYIKLYFVYIYMIVDSGQLMRMPCDVQTTTVRAIICTCSTCICWIAEGQLVCNILPSHPPPPPLSLVARFRPHEVLAVALHLFVALVLRLPIAVTFEVVKYQSSRTVHKRTVIVKLSG